MFEFTTKRVEIENDYSGLLVGVQVKCGEANLGTLRMSSMAAPTFENIIKKHGNKVESAEAKYKFWNKIIGKKK